MTRMLVVASPTLSPLSTPGPVPTEGQREWFRLTGDGRYRPGDIERPYAEACPDCVEDGPFPFTVAVWQQAEACSTCDAMFPAHSVDLCWPRGVHPPSQLVPAGGAVVATVEVTGESHPPDCYSPRGDDNYCHPGAEPHCWHTPTGEVRKLDAPVPMERPSVEVDGAEVVIAERGLSWWWAAVEVRP